MATLKNTIKKAEKLSVEKIKIGPNSLHFVNYKGYCISFYPNGRIEENTLATCFNTKKNLLKDDPYINFNSGTNHENISQCFAHIDRMTKQSENK